MDTDIENKDAFACDRARIAIGQQRRTLLLREALSGLVRALQFGDDDERRSALRSAEGFLESESEDDLSFFRSKSINQQNKHNEH